MDQSVTTRHGRVDGRCDSLNYPLHHTPPIPAEDDDGDLPAFQILLISKTVVGRQQHLKTGVLGHQQKASIGECVPSFLKRCPDNVSVKKARYWQRRTLVKKDAHPLNK